MRFFSVVLYGALCAGLVFTGGVSTARADSGQAGDAVAASAETAPAAAALPGSVDEARAYEQREAASPAVQDFKGGDVTIGVSVFVLILVIVVIVLLSK
ncbi:MAG TPA: hypothetical protein VFS92_08140 [Planctomycetota bacterium]|nr:hypothetical protein [Planctomycetota bacterium]